MVQLTRVTHLSAQKGRWVALLISMHMSFLYEHTQGQKKELDAFLDGQKANQEKWRKDLKISLQEVKRAYDLMKW